MTMHSCDDPQCAHGSEQVSKSGSEGSGATLSPGRRDFLKDSLAAGAGLLGLSALSGCASMITSGAPADTLLVNGRIATLDRRQSIASALAIRGDSIAAVGPAPSPIRSGGR